MVVSDPTIDPITGLPLLNPNTPIQQIPLGADVFPFADLKASAQPARGPIYGDDIIPTSSLLSGQHPTLGNAQTVQTDGHHATRTRESVFQNLGAKIPDGTTAPVDVNVVSGGGGGVTNIVPALYYTNGYQDQGHSADTPAQVPSARYRYLHGWQVAVWWMCPGTGTGPSGFISFSLRGDGFAPAFILAGFPTVNGALTMTAPVTLQSELWLSEPWDMQGMCGAVTNYQFALENIPASMYAGWDMRVYVT